MNIQMLCEWNILSKPGYKCIYMIINKVLLSYDSNNSIL